MNIIGSNSIALSEVNSTNEYAYKLLSQSKQIDGTIVAADYQTNGKGQGNNVWESNKGDNLLLSIILYPDFLSADKQFYLSMAISLGILKTVKAYIKSEVKIKWTNDVYVKNRKISGILIRNILSGNTIKSSIVGIGLNVNQNTFLEEGMNRTSLNLENNKKNDRAEVLKRLIDNLNFYYNKLKMASLFDLKQEYEKNMLKYNILANYKLANGDLIAGVINGVNKSGYLKITIDNSQKLFAHKEIIFN